MRYGSITPVLLLLLLPCACALPVDVSIAETLRASSPYLDYSRDLGGAPQRFVLNWENQGSVSCKVRIRADIYGGNASAHTAWSDEQAVEPGDSRDFEVYFYPNRSDTYTATITSYYCNTVDVIGNASFTSSVAEADPAKLEVRTASKRDRVEVTIKAGEELKDMVIVPAKYPLGWIAESAKIEGMKAGEERTVDLPYFPEVWKPAEMVYHISSADGRRHASFSVDLKEESRGYSLEQLAMGALSVAVLLLSALLLKEKRKKE